MDAPKYKDTLNLPQTDFPMKADLAKREPGWLKNWQDNQLYEKVQQSRKDQKNTFILHDGPPYANGNLHVGHAINKILKDIIIKAKVLSGFRAPYVPGWDCHGLPIELVIEKKYGKVGHKLNAAEFRAKCREYAQSQIDIQREDFKRLGILGDWDHPYITMDNSYEAEQVRVLAQIYKHNYIKKGFKPVHWCLDCSSSLAEAEVEYQDKISDSIYVKFQLQQENETTHVLIWTTTPWTLPANMAVAAHPDIVYVFVKINGQQFLLAEKLLETVFPGESIEILRSCTGKALEGLMLKHCFEDREVPFILGDHVTLDAGTGFVHTAPAHGIEDFAVCKKYGIEVYSPVGEKGCYLAHVPFVSGVHVSQANPKIIALLLEKAALLRHSKITHSYPHCWRHKTPLIFRATPQWFISMQHLESKAVQASNEVVFTPPEGRNRFMSMLEGRPDWCISRQRTWGVPIPFFVHKETGALHPDTAAILAKVADAIAAKGLESWFQAVPETFGVDSTEYDKTTDTLDVWLDSGSSSQCVLKQRPELVFPADLYLEGSDQHRAWFQSSLLTAIAASDAKPYRQILTHGFLVDGEGRKMSKSIGNIVSIEQAVNQYGADIVRLWVAMSDYRGEIAYSPAIIQQTADLYRKIRNTLRYILAALQGFSLQNQIPISELIEFDAFMIHLAASAQAEIQAIFVDNDFTIRTMMTKVHAFCENELSNIYFDVLKDRLYTENDWNRRSAQTALLHILHYLIRMITPVLSFTADEVWQELKKMGLSSEESVFILSWYTLADSASMDLNAWHTAWPILKKARALLNQSLDILRKDKTIGSNLDIACTLTAAPSGLITEAAACHELKYFFIVSEFDMQSERVENTELRYTTEISMATKCERCWHLQVSVGQQPDHPLLCDRCYANITNTGKKRRYF